jgi:hypothetical protein
MTQGQLTRAVEDMLRRNSTDPESLVVGRARDGAPVLYDPKSNIIVIHDPKALDAETVFKPDVPDLKEYLGRKMQTQPALARGAEAISPPPIRTPATPPTMYCFTRV